MSKYQSLSDHLAALNADEWRASFAEVEAILGFSLPKAALTEARWWSNDDDKPHKRAWLDAGWRVADLDRRDAKVVFERREPRVGLTAELVVAPPVAVAETREKQTGKGRALWALAAGAAAVAVGLGVAAARLLRRRG